MLQRRLQPVYQAIFVTRDYKSALKLLDKKDLAKFGLSRALKALALEGRGMRTEALEEVQSLMADEKNLQSDTVHYASQALARLGAENELRQLFAKAIGSDVDHMDAYFEACIRENLLSEAATTSMRMAKAKGSEDYLAWCGTVMLWEGLMLAENDAENHAEANKKFAFAEAMLRKVLAREKINKDANPNAVAAASPSSAATAVRGLCVLVAQAMALQGKPAKAAEFVEEENLGGAPARDRLLFLAELRQLAGEHSKALDHFLQLVTEEDPEDWRNWCGAIENAFSAGEDARRKVLETASKLSNNPDIGNKPRRGPLLATIHVYLRAYLGGERDEVTAKELVAKIVEYFEAFDSKSCCFGDLRNALLPFVDAIPMVPSALKPDVVTPPPANMVFMNMKRGQRLPEEIEATSWGRRWDDETFTGICATLRPQLESFLQDRLKTSREMLLEQVSNPENIDESTKAKLKAAVRTCLSCYQCLRFLGSMEGQDEAASLKLINELLEVYEKTKFLDEGAQGGQREVKIGDELVILAAHTLIDMANRREDGGAEGGDAAATQHLLTAAALLESAFEHSPNGFQLTLVLLEIYLRLGVVPRACEAYNTLSIKYIQNDSLSHLLLGALLHFGFMSEAIEICRQIQDLWTGSRRENAAFAVNALAQKNFPEVNKILSIDRRLRTSHQRAVAVSERFLVNLENEFMELPSEEARKFIRHQTVTTEGAEGDDRFSFLITRLADVEAWGMENLAPNYDFTTKVSWDCPMGHTAVRERKSISTRTPGWSQSRACTASRSYRTAWSERARDWIELRAAFAEVAGVVARGTLPSEDFAEVMEARITELCGRLDLTSSLTWTAAQTTMKFALSTLSNDTSAENLTTTVEIACAQLEEATKAVEKQSSRECAWDLCNGAVMITTLIRLLGDLFPKPKKKKNKKSDDATEGRQEALRKLLSSQEAYIRGVQKYVQAQSPDSPIWTASEGISVAPEWVDKITAYKKEALAQTQSNCKDSAKKQLDALTQVKF